MSSAIVHAGKDTWLNANKPSKNFGKSNRLVVDKDEKEILIQLRSPVPRGATVQSAQLVLNSPDSPSGTFAISCARYTKVWAQTGATWNKQPRAGNTAGSTVTVSKTDPSAGQWVFDVTDIVQAIADGNTFTGFRIWSGSTTALSFYSLQAGKNRPYLQAEWSTAPEQPTILKPAHGAVAPAKPKLSCDFTDHSGSTTLKSMQVQIDADDSWTSPDWDSGEQFVDHPTLDLSTTDFAGIDPGATTYWRVRVRDGDNQWSPWSDSVPIVRYLKGTVTIGAPAASPDNYVAEMTPPIVWAFSATQTHFQVLVTDADDLKTVFHDSGKVKGDDDTYTIPKGVLDEDGSYSVRVRCWDNVTREDTAGDSVYAEATRDFTVQFDATVDPVDTLTLSQAIFGGGVSNTKPWVDLTWTRSTPPDSWTIIRDGKTIESDLDLSESIISVDPDGVTYHYRDFGARPSVQHQWRVRPCVNGKLASGGPAPTFTPGCVGIWLVDMDHVNSRQVVLGGLDFDTSQDDLAGTYQTLGSPDVIRAVSGLSGLSGNVRDGLLYTRGSTLQWQNMEADLYWMKSRPARVYRLVWGDLSIPVAVGNIKVAPSRYTKSDRVVKAVSFDWWQVAEHPFKENF